MVLSTGTSLLSQLSTYLYTLARYDLDYDVRDRARFLGTLLRGLRPEQSHSTEAENGNTKDEEAEELSGVVLRREQVKVVLMGRGIVVEVGTAGESGFEVGSMSRAVNKRLAGYEELPEWTDEPTDSSLRAHEVRPQVDLVKYLV
jgi:AP-3 complex subunit beta